MYSLLLLTTFLSFLQSSSSSIVKSLLSWYNTLPEDERLLHAEIVSMRTELSKISIVNNFSTHAKLQRRINAVEMDLKQLTQQRLANNLKNKMTWTYGIQILIAITMFYVLITKRNAPVILLDRFDLYPFSTFISYPCIETNAVSIHVWYMISNFMIRKVKQLVN